MFQRRKGKRGRGGEENQDGGWEIGCLQEAKFYLKAASALDIFGEPPPLPRGRHFPYLSWNCYSRQTEGEK